MRAIKTITISILAVGLLAGSAVGVAAQSAVVTDTGNGFTGDDCSTTPEGAEFCTGGRWEFDDPRLTGDYETTITTASGFETGLEGEVVTEEFRVTNDEGAWSGQAIMGILFLEDGETVSGGTNYVLTGEDAYEGLTAWVYAPFDGSRFPQGIIVEAASME